MLVWPSIHYFYSDGQFSEKPAVHMLSSPDLISVITRPKYDKHFYSVREILMRSLILSGLVVSERITADMLPE